jgi:hypothetical protein
MHIQFHNRALFSNYFFGSGDFQHIKAQNTIRRSLLPGSIGNLPNKREKSRAFYLEDVKFFHTCGVSSL